MGAAMQWLAAPQGASPGGATDISPGFQPGVKVIAHRA